MTDGAVLADRRYTTPRPLRDRILVAWAPAVGLTREPGRGGLAEVVPKAGFHVMAMA